MPDIFEKAWKAFIEGKVQTEDGVKVPRPEGPSKVSLSALPGGPHLDGPLLTWEPERMLSGFRLPDPRIINEILEDLVQGDSLDQVEKIYQHEYASAMLQEYWKVRLDRVKGQWEEWKHVAAKAAEGLAAAEASGGEVAVAMQYAILDRAQGRVIHWSKAVAQEQNKFQQQDARVHELARPVMEAITLLEERHKANVGWMILAYSAAREDAIFSVSGGAHDCLPSGNQADD